MKAHELTINGMSCAHCVMHVKKALDTINGLEVENVELGSAKVWFEEDRVSREEISQKIEEAGYRLVYMQ